MSDNIVRNIVPLGRLGDTGAPDEALIAVLKDLLAKAEAGEMRRS